MVYSGSPKYVIRILRILRDHVNKVKALCGYGYQLSIGALHGGHDLISIGIYVEICEGVAGFNAIPTFPK